MTVPPDDAAGGRRAAQPLTDAERAADELLTQAHLCAPHQLPGLLARHGEQLGVSGAVAYLADLQQDVLVRSWAQPARRPARRSSHWESTGRSLVGPTSRSRC